MKNIFVVGGNAYMEYAGFHICGVGSHTFWLSQGSYHAVRSGWFCVEFG